MTNVHPNNPDFHMPHPGLPCNKDCGGVAPEATTQDGYIYLTLRVKLDSMPGTFHTQASAIESIQGILNSHIPHYEPKVTPEL